MAENDRITQMISQGLALWEPENRLEQLSQEEIRFSRGFLPCNLSELLKGFAERWLPLFLSVDATVQFKFCTTHLGVAPEQDQQLELSIDEEPAVLSFNDSTAKVIALAVFKEDEGLGAEILSEYIARRLVYTVGQSLRYDTNLNFKFVSHLVSDVEPAIAYVHLSFSVNDEDCDFYFSLGGRAIEYIDSSWRRHITRRTSSRGFQYSDQLHSVSVELAELNVEPAVLIDYVRSGTVINLDTPLQSPVLVRLNDAPWFKGTLAIFRGYYVVRAEQLKCEATELEDGRTRVRIELARFQIDQEGVIEGQQRGALLATRVTASPNASLIIGGEQVANATIHETQGKFSLTVLPR